MERQPDDDAVADSVVPIKMEGDGPLVVRQKFHHARPITIDQALLEMELVGHDFYLFHDIEEDAPSVVYRRHGYQYGVIRLIENSAGGEDSRQAEGRAHPSPCRSERRGGRGGAGCGDKPGRPVGRSTRLRKGKASQPVAHAQARLVAGSGPATIAIRATAPA